MGGPLTLCTSFPTSLGLKGQTGDPLLVRRVYTSVKYETADMEIELPRVMYNGTMNSVHTVANYSLYACNKKAKILFKKLKGISDGLSYSTSQRNKRKYHHRFTHPQSHPIHKVATNKSATC